MVFLTDLQNVCFLQHLAKSTGGCQRQTVVSGVIKFILEYCNNGANLAQWPGQLTISVIYVITYFNQYHEALFFFPNGYCCGLTSCMNVNIFQVCRKCGLLGYYNHKLKTSYCSMCKNGENMAKMRLPYACKLLFQVLHKSVMYCFNHRT